MAQHMKYIIFEVFVQPDGWQKHDVPFVFPTHLIHAEVARTLSRGGLVGSAGFCKLQKTNQGKRDPKVSVNWEDADKDKDLGVRWICWGESQSLKVKSNPDEDQRLLDKWYR